MKGMKIYIDPLLKHDPQDYYFTVTASALGGATPSTTEKLTLRVICDTTSTSVSEPLLGFQTSQTVIAQEENTGFEFDDFISSHEKCKILKYEVENDNLEYKFINNKHLIVAKNQKLL